jgi:hypothetical protein
MEILDPQMTFYCKKGELWSNIFWWKIVVGVKERVGIQTERLLSYNA